MLQHFLKFQFLIIIVSVLAGIYYPQILDTFKSSFYDVFFSNSTETLSKSTVESFGSTTKHEDFQSSKEFLFTKEELSKFDGSDENAPIYISILGSVFDVTKGRKHYGTGCAYNMFAGKDASASFISGNFETFDENSDDVIGMKLSQIWELNNWRDFYTKEYTFKGKLIGRYYDEQGLKTKYHLQLDELIILAQNEKEEIKKEKLKFPHCNIEWDEKTGTRVWCTKSSGGVERDWVGVPRKYLEDQSLTKEFRCACVKDEFLDSPKLREYENCDSEAPECFYKVN